MTSHGSDIGYAVELFSKTDQYDAHVREDLIVSAAEAPPPPEPDRNSIVIDRENDVWRYGDGTWVDLSSGTSLTWDTLVASYGPVKAYGEIS